MKPVMRTSLYVPEFKTPGVGLDTQLLTQVASTEEFQADHETKARLENASNVEPIISKNMTHARFHHHNRRAS